MSCGVSCRHSSDPSLLWLWYRLAATARVRPLAWEPPCATGTALEKPKKKKKDKKGFKWQNSILPFVKIKKKVNMKKNLLASEFLSWLSG